MQQTHLKQQEQKKLGFMQNASPLREEVGQLRQLKSIHGDCSQGPGGSNGACKNILIINKCCLWYGVYMAISSNLRYQVLAGVIEQRLLEPMLHKHKLFLSAICFAVRTGNTYLGSLLWVDYARFIGIQKAEEVVEA